MKKYFLSLLAAVIAAGSMAGCGGNTQESANVPKDSDKVKIVAAIFPEYDWARNIALDNAEITLLQDNGADLHSFQPTAEDILKLTDCDLFIYTGGESDEWVEEALENAPDVKALNLMEILGGKAKEEEVKEGMQAEEEEHEEHEDEPEYDEHIWLSVKNAKILCGEIANELCALDPENADKYNANLADYTARLDKLDDDFAQLAENAENKTLIFGDRFPFRYFVDDYGLDYYAAFVGCSAETAASFETVTFLSQKADELGAKTIYVIDGSDQKIAQAVADGTKDKNRDIAVLDSMQSVTAKQVNEGETYISAMQKNYDTLKETLK